MSNKANEDILNSLHLMTATKIAQLLREAEGEPELMIKVLREARGFLKDNQVSADISTSVPLQQIQQEQVNIAELPFAIEDDE